VTFDWADFLAPLGPEVLFMAFLLGMAMGAAIRGADHRMDWAHAFWMLSGGIVFFLPLSLLRGLQTAGEGSSAVWERFLATLILWAVYVGGMLTVGLVTKGRRHD